VLTSFRAQIDAGGPVTVTDPDDGRSRPAINDSKVDLPAPFTPIRPVRPGEKEAVRPSKTRRPSGQEKLSSLRTMQGPPERAGAVKREDTLGLQG